MSKTLFSSQISKLQLEILDSSFQNRLLNFPAESPFQSPLMKENSDVFINNWIKSGEPLALSSFFGEESLAFFVKVLKRKQEDFGVFDLFLAAGFLKWSGNKMSPTLLIPLKVDLQNFTVQLSDLPPIENIPLRESTKNEGVIPRVSEALINNRLDVEKYFAMIEMAAAKQPFWKFSIRGLCLSFFSTSHFYLHQNLDFQINKSTSLPTDNSIYFKLFNDEGFRVADSIFDKKEANNAYHPADHAFLYPTDFSTVKASIDALSPKNEAYVIQTPPGTFVFETAANIIADSLFNHKKVLVLTKRAVTTEKIKLALYPEFRSYTQLERPEAQKKLRKMRDDLTEYYNIANSKTPVGGICLSELFEEKSRIPPIKNKIADAVFSGIEKLNFQDYRIIQKTIATLVHEFSNPATQKAQEAFKSCDLKVLNKEQQNRLAELLEPTIENIDRLTPFIKVLETTVLSESITLDKLAQAFDLIQTYFDADTPTYEGWDLQSSDWDNYGENILSIPESGSIWSRFRRDGSLIYTEGAIDESILATRDEFAEITKNSFRAFSDNYRSRKKKLLSLFREPKEIESDDELILLVDELIEIQNHRNFYKNSMPMGNRLFGKTWKYERTNWVLLHLKQKYFYDLKHKIKDPIIAELLFGILEKYHLLKNLELNIELAQAQLSEIQKNQNEISTLLSLAIPLELISLTEQGNLLRNWMDSLSCLDIHVQTNAWIDRLNQKNLGPLVDYVFDKSLPNEDLTSALAAYWCQQQIQEFTKQKNDLFSVSPQKRTQNSKAFRALLDDYCSTNFKFLEDTIQKYPESLQIFNVCDFYASPKNYEQKFDLLLILDAEIISTAESVPAIVSTTKMIVMGDTETPELELLFIDALEKIEHTQKMQVSKQQSILNQTLQKGAGSRTLCLSRQYQHPALFYFINQHFYNNTIQQFPLPHKLTFKGLGLKKVPDTIKSLIDAAVQHAKAKPSQTLGIIAFSEGQCQEIHQKLEAEIEASPSLKGFFSPKNLSRYCFIKTPERAVGLYRDCILICIDEDLEYSAPITREKIKVCASLAKQDLQVFASIATMTGTATATTSPVLAEWFDYLQKYKAIDFFENKEAPSSLLPYVQTVLEKNNVSFELGWALNKIAINLCIHDNNNQNRFLAAIEDDFYPRFLKESIEDIEYMRPVCLGALGWKMLSTWSPVWITSTQDEIDHLLTTISIEQSVAPTAEEVQRAPESQVASNETEELLTPEITVKPYVIKNPKIEGTAHHKPIPELPLKSIIVQLLFYVDKESPIHGDCLRKRLLNLHQLDREGPKITQILDDALKQGIQAKAFVKTGPFYYSLKPTKIKLRFRGDLNPEERKFSYVSPEERALLPASMNNASIRQLLGLLE